MIAFPWIAGGDLRVISGRSAVLEWVGVMTRPPDAEDPAAKQQEPDCGGHQVGRDEHGQLHHAVLFRVRSTAAVQRDPLVIARPNRKIPKPWNWCRTASSRPRMPQNVSRRLAAVLPIAVSAGARKLASCAAATPRNRTRTARGRPECSRSRSRRTGSATWSSRVAPPGVAGSSGARPSWRRTSAKGRAPVASAPPTSTTTEQVLPGGADDVDPGIGRVDPVHRDLVNAQPAPLGQDEQFGVEEPPRVLHHGQQLLRHVGAGVRLEPALRIGEVRRRRPPQNQVVAPGDQLPSSALGSPASRDEASLPIAMSE